MNLHLPLKKKYFFQIVTGLKKEEYRLCNAYWQKRIENHQYDSIVFTEGYPKKGDSLRTHIVPFNGYQIKTITHPQFGPDPVQVYAFPIFSSSKNREDCGCCSGTGIIKDNRFHDGDEESCLTCNGKGFFEWEDNSSPSLALEERPQAGITCGLPVVKRCLDTLRISLWLEWENDSLLTHLDEQKELVQSTENDEIPVCTDSTYTWNLHRTGTSKFNFRLTSGDTFILLNKRKSDGVIPTCRVEIGSISCWSPGYARVYQDIKGFLKLNGARIVKERVSEVHIAADFVGMNITTLDIEDMNKWIMKSTSYDLYYKHRRFSGLSVGKGDLMLRIYDKVLELKTQRATHKQEIFAEVWQVSKYDDKPVTRVEFQIRRPKLREFNLDNKEEKIDTIEDLTAALPSLWQYFTKDWVRHTLKAVDRTNKNQSKAGISEFWQSVRNVVWTGLLEYIRNHPPKHKDIDGLRKQARGILMSICAALDIEPDDIDKIVAISQDLIEEDLHELFEKGETFIDKMKIKRNEALSVLSTVVPF